MTREEAIKYLERADITVGMKVKTKTAEAIEMAIKALKQEPIDKSAMMCELYMEGVNMSGEYQGCWVRFKDIEKVVDKYIGDKE